MGRGWPGSWEACGAAVLLGGGAEGAAGSWAAWRVGGTALRALFSAEAAGGEPEGQGTRHMLSTSRVLTRLPQSLKSNAPKIDGGMGRGEWRTRVGAGACPALPSAAAHAGKVSAC